MNHPSNPDFTPEPPEAAEEDDSKLTKQLIQQFIESMDYFENKNRKQAP